MTEYDYSPEAIERHIRKQQQIARWVDATNKCPPRNPFTPATPAVRPVLTLQPEYYPDDGDHADSRSHRRKDSKDRRDRPRDRDRDRAIPVQEREPKPSSRPHARRHRSASHSATTINARPDAVRSYSIPPPLPIPAYAQQQTSPNYPTGYPSYPYGQKVTSPRDSRHSSQSSSTLHGPQQPSPTSFFPKQQPYSAPAAYQPMVPPVRSLTTPPVHVYPQDNYGHLRDVKYNYTNQHYPTGYPAQMDMASAPQYPHSMYQHKPPPLLKRLFLNLTGGNRQPPPPSRRHVRRKRSSSF